MEDTHHISVRETEDDYSRRGGNDHRGSDYRGGGYYGGGGGRGGPSLGIGFDF